MKTTLLALMLFLTSLVSAQVQTIRGQVRDKESHQPIAATVSVITYGADTTWRGITDAQGEFKIENVKVGRQDLQISAENYKTAVLNNIIVTSAKEVILQVELEEDAAKSINEIVIKAKPKSGEPNNENALVSARVFTVDETDRYAGSRGDPARMASNFAGVQGADDSRNDIVIRGNSPSGVLWRLEGIDIPNPNHFAIPGTTGGPVSIINNKILSNSDFFTGAFPAEYGNSTAGAFDF